MFIKNFNNNVLKCQKPKKNDRYLKFLERNNKEINKEKMVLILKLIYLKKNMFKMINSIK